jgi:hypothetical protein
MIEFENGNKAKYDLLVAIPLHRVPEVIRNSNLIKEGQNWIKVDRFSLETDYQNVFCNRGRKCGSLNYYAISDSSYVAKSNRFGCFHTARIKT